MENIEDYILRPLADRQTHLDLNESCIERGGKSTYFSGMLADRLNTTIPSGMKIHVCHACHNAKCSNFKHLYYGTPRENKADSIAFHGKISVWQRMVNKYGEEEARNMQRRKSNTNGRGNINKPKPEAQRRKISETLKGRVV